MYNLSLFFSFSSRMFEPTFSLFRHFVYFDLSRNLVPRSSHSLRLSRHFEYISILVGNFDHVILLCARVFSRAAAILKSEKTLGTRLLWVVKKLLNEYALNISTFHRKLPDQTAKDHWSDHKLIPSHDINKFCKPIDSGSPVFFLVVVIITVIFFLSSSFFHPFPLLIVIWRKFCKRYFVWRPSSPDVTWRWWW